MIQNQYLSKYITSQCSKLSPYFSPIHNLTLSQFIIMFCNLSDTGFHGKFEHGTASLRHVCKHKEEKISHVRWIVSPFLTAARIMKCIILMADYNPERIMYL